MYLRVARRQRVVEVVLGAELGDERRRTGPLATHACRGISGQCENHGKDNERGPKQHRDHLEQSPKDVLVHVTSLDLTPSGGVFPRRGWTSRSGARRARPCAAHNIVVWMVRGQEAGVTPRLTPDRPSACRHWAGRPTTLPRFPHREVGGAGVTYFSAEVEKSIVPNAVTFTPVTLFGPAELRGRVPHRDGRHVAGEHALGLLVLGVGRGAVLGGRSLLQQLVELGAAVVAVVRAGVGAVDRGEEVLDRRVVHLPAGAEHALHLPVRDLATERGEVDDRGRRHSRHRGRS